MTKLEMLQIWLAAKILPVVIIFILTGRIYYQLHGPGPVMAELSISLLSLFIPVVFLYFKLQDPALILDRLALKSMRWHVLGWGIIGFGVFFICLLITNYIFGPPFSYNFKPKDDLSFWIQLINLLILIPISEEVLFRGYLQTGFMKEWGVVGGISIVAILFGLSHLFSDIYFGREANISMWASRLIQLYSFAFILGLVRWKTGSMLSSWIIHEGIILIISWNFIFSFNK